jgi:hypothetical protein
MDMIDECKRKTCILAVILVAAMLLGACNLPSSEPTPDAFATGIALTVAAQLTSAAVPVATTPAPPTPTATPEPPTATPPTPTTPTATLPPSPTPGCLDKASFITDVTIPDDTNLAAGASFTKTWRLKNIGTCTWDTSYATVFFGGNAMGGAAAVNLPATVPPNSTIDVSVNMTAPSTNGTHRGDWKLRNSKGVIFGLGDGGGPFYVQIVVGPTPTPAAEVYSAKAIDVPQTYTADLDEGVVSPPAGNKDVWFNAVSAVEKYLVPQNGALLKKWASSIPSFEDCKGAALSGSSIPLADVPQGSWVCYKTNLGRYGRFEVESITGDPVQTIRMDYRTWK